MMMGNLWREFDFWFSFSVSSAATIIYFIRLPLSLELTSVSDFLFSPAWTETCFFFSLWFFYMERWHRVLFCLFCLALLALRNKEKCWQCFVITMYLLYILKKVTLVQNISWIDTDCEFGIFPHAQSSKKNKHSLSIYSQLNQFNRFRWLLKCPGFLYQRKQKRPKGVGKVLREETMCLFVNVDLFYKKRQ
jgi:hypothetical protein